MQKRPYDSEEYKEHVIRVYAERDDFGNYGVIAVIVQGPDGTELPRLSPNDQAFDTREAAIQYGLAEGRSLVDS